MSILETVKKGHVLFGDGLFDIPSTKAVQHRITSNLLPHQEKFCADTEHRKLALVCGFGAGKTYALVSKSAIICGLSISQSALNCVLASFK